MQYPSIGQNQLKFAGNSLKRPECALAHKSGWVFVPNWSERGGIAMIAPNGETHALDQLSVPWALRPNGIALNAEGYIVLAHLGDERGGVFTLHPSGELTPRVETANNEPLPPTNFVVHDSQNRLWITVSTRVSPRANDYRRNASTGFIAVAEPGCTNARIVADNLGYANEIVIDEDRQCVFVNETFARRLSRFDLYPDARLGGRETVIDFGAGCYPDGLVWITSIVSNRILVCDTNNNLHTLFQDVDNAQLQATEDAFNNQSLGRPHLDISHGSLVHNISNLAFGGPDLTTAYLGNLLGHSLPNFQASVRGKAMPHWQVPIEHWLNHLQVQKSP